MEQKGIADFQPYVGKKRKPGLGCITEMNEERKNLKEQLVGIAPPEKPTRKQRKLWDYTRLHPEVATIAKGTGLARNTVKKHYEMVAAMLGRKQYKYLV